MCFNANIFGWVMTLVIPFSNVRAIEKKMTAFVLPNAITVTENVNKHTFASFLSRDTTYDVIHNIWKHSRPVGESTEEDAAKEAPSRLPTAHRGAFGLDGGSEGPKRRSPIAPVRNLAHIIPMWYSGRSSVAPTSRSTTRCF